MSDYDDLALPLGAYTGEDDDTPTAMIGVDRDAPAVSDDFTRFVASTSREDRHGTVIDQQSWRLANFRRNPVILLNHRSSGLPVGRGEQVKIVDIGKPEARLEVGVRWDMADPEAAVIAGKFARGFMTSGSVSFRAGKATDRSKLPEDHFAHRKPKEDDSPWWPSLFYERAELLEFSAVTIPSNVDAQAIRAWGARQVSPVEAAAQAHALAAEDPAEQLRRMVAELLPRAETRDVLLAALADAEIAERIRSIVFPPAPRPTRKADPLDYLFAPKEG